MRILHVVNDANTGGAQTLIESLAKKSSLHDEVHVFVLMAEGDLSERLKQVTASVTYARLSRRSKNIWRAILMLRRMVSSLKIDVVHSHLLQSDLVAILAMPAVPLVSTVHTSGSHESNWLSRCISKCVALLSRKFSAVVACTPAAKSYATAMRYPRSAVMPVISNGTYIPEFSGKVSNSKVFVCLSRWHEMKDHRTLLAAFKIFRSGHPDWRLVCAGNGVSWDNEELITMLMEEEVTDGVELLGPVSDTQSLLSQSSALVISSSHGEALPMAGIEALAHGIPVITTDVGDCAALVTYAPFLVSPRSPQELAKAMDVMASLSESELDQVRITSWTKAKEQFDAVETERSYRQLYADLVGRSNYVDRPGDSA